MLDAARALIGRHVTAARSPSLSLARPARSCRSFNGAVRGSGLLGPAADPVSADAAAGRVARRCPEAPPTAELPGPNLVSFLFSLCSSLSSPLSTIRVRTSSCVQDSNGATDHSGLSVTVAASLDFSLDTLALIYCLCSFLEKAQFAPPAGSVPPA